MTVVRFHYRPPIFLEPWCNGSIRKKGYPVKDTVSNLQNSIHKDVIVVRIHGAPPIYSCDAIGRRCGLRDRMLQVRSLSGVPNNSPRSIMDNTPGYELGNGGSIPSAGTK